MCLVFPFFRWTYHRHPGRAMRSEVFARSVLDERVTLVTGGGTGLGKAAARELPPAERAS